MGHTVLGLLPELQQATIQKMQPNVMAHIHEHGRLPILFAEIHPMGRVLQQVPVSSGLAAHQKREHHTQTEDHEAEDVGNGPGRHLQSLSSRGRRQFHTHGLKENGLEEKGGHTHRDGSRIQIKSLVYLGRMGQTGGQEEANHQQPF